MAATFSKLYRFAVYGRSASGKTCLLAALAMPRTAHPAGCSCSWLPEVPGLTKRKEVDAYRKGRELIENSRAALREGRKPPPNKPDPDFPRFRFNFTATSPWPHTFCVELIDYAGELIDPNASAAQLAVRLRRRLGKVDAVLVLGEAPRSDQKAEKLHEEFELLKQAFALLRVERSGEPALRVPVALLLNKWDRLHPAGGTAHDRERELRDFLSSHPQPAHIALANALRGAVAEGCFRTFAVSAFGTSRTESITDSEGEIVTEAELPPLAVPLPSFGLEDPFIWAARQRDGLDQQALKQDVDELSFASRWPWLYANAVAFWTAWGLWRRARQLARRFPSGTGESPLTRIARRKARKAAVLRTLTAVGLLTLLGLAVEATRDGTKRRHIENDLTRPESTPELLVQNEQWLDGYAGAPGYRHLLSRLFFSRADAKQLLEMSRQRREEGLWHKVQEAPNELAKEAPATGYLGAFPNGGHAEEANGIIQQAGDIRHERENQDHLDAMRRAFNEQKAKGFPDADQLRGLEQQLPKMPHPDAETRKQHADRRQLADDIGAALVRGLKQDFRNAYEALMTEGKLGEAAKLLEKQQPPLKELVAEFPTRALKHVERDYRRHLADGRWRDAEDDLNQLDSPPVDQYLSRDDIKKVERLRRDIAVAEDRYLYGQLCLYKDLKRAQAYRDTAPRRQMRDEAAAYLKYLSDRQNAISLTLRISRIEWGNVWDRDTEYTVTLNGRPIMEGKVHARSNTVSTNLDQAKITYCLKDQANLAVHLKHSGTVWNTDYGSPSWEGSIERLDGRRLTLEGKDPPSHIDFRLEGVPQEPPLPPYREE